MMRGKLSSIHGLAQKYKLGGAVRRFRYGGDEGELVDTFPVQPQSALEPRPLPEMVAPESPVMMPPYAGRSMPVTESPATQPISAAAVAPTPVSPAANDLMSMVQRYMGEETTYGPELKAARARADAETKAFSDMIANATKDTSTAPDKAELYFRLAAAFGSPTKTGKFAENLGLAGRELADYSKDVRTAKKADQALRLQLGLEAQKLRAQGAREELTSLRTLAGEEMKDKRAVVAEYLKSGRPQSEAGKAAVDAGLKQGTPEFTNFVNKYIDDKVRSGNIFKEAMAAIAAGNLAVRQSAETRQAEAGKKLTPAEIKLKSEAEATLGSLEDSMATLKRAYELNPNTFDGTLAGIMQRKFLEQTDPNNPQVLATREQANLLSKGAVEKLRASFGGNPTEGERNILLALEGIDSKSKTERADIMKNSFRLLKARRDREKKRLEDISAGLYRETTPTTSSEGID